MKIESILRAYEKHLAGTISKARAMSAIKRLRKLGGHDVKNVSAHIQAYIDERKASAGTINRELGILQSAIRYAFKRGVVKFLPIIQKLPSPPPRSKFLTEEAIKRLLDSTKSRPELDKFVRIALMTGQRKQAILKLRWEQVDWDANLIDFNDPTAPLAHRMKGRGVVPMSDALRAFLSAYRLDSGGVFNTKYIDSSWRTVMKETGLNITPHILRHTVATQLAQKSVPMYQISKILGHKNTHITEKVYAKYSPEFCKEAVKHLSL